jgi:lysozyme family protein
MVDPRVLAEQQVGVEGGYSNNPDDPGGETMWGWTLHEARAFGYTGAMKDLPREQAIYMFVERYWNQPKLDLVQSYSDMIAEKLLEIGINMGQATGIGFLQRALNVLNASATLYPDIAVDGGIGKMTLYCLKAYLDHRGFEGEHALLEMLRAQQSVRYIVLAEKNVKLETFEYGWQHNRV